jgi:hypothetical protein
MSAVPQHVDAARLDRALDRLAAHCELAAWRAGLIEQKRVVVRTRLEEELGPELTRMLLTGLAP